MTCFKRIYVLMISLFAVAACSGSNGDSPGSRTGNDPIEQADEAALTADERSRYQRHLSLREILLIGLRVDDHVLIPMRGVDQHQAGNLAGKVCAQGKG